ncbi:MAG TPA: ArsR family transcriptional regulator [Thermoplasmatales archaeon]|nr:ArsR family transcriptional regulator [Thermoplasmatales archaeon]
MGEKITLDRESFTALASDSRIKILRILERRQMTLSEIAREMDMSKPAVLKHMSRLLEAGLVKKIEGERKWIYYRLTSKGKNVLHPERVQIILLLSSFAASAAGAVAMLWKYVHEKGVGVMENEGMPLNATYDAGNASRSIAHASPPETWLHMAIALGIFAVTMLLLSLVIHIRARKNQL